MNEQETIADIIAEMRRGTKLPGFWSSCDVNKILQYHADRLEAAHKRERGDAAKLREALEKIVELTTPCEGVTSIELQVQGEAITALEATEKEGGNNGNK